MQKRNNEASEESRWCVIAPKFYCERRSFSVAAGQFGGPQVARLGGVALCVGWGRRGTSLHSQTSFLIHHPALIFPFIVFYLLLSGILT